MNVLIFPPFANKSISAYYSFCHYKVRRGPKGPLRLLIRHCFCPRLQQLRDAGVLHRIRSNAWHSKADEDKTLWTSVSTEAVTPIFTILAIGIMLSTVLMILEKQACHLVQKSRRHQRTSRKLKWRGVRGE